MLVAKGNIKYPLSYLVKPFVALCGKENKLNQKYSRISCSDRVYEVRMYLKDKFGLFVHSKSVSSLSSRRIEY